MTLHTAAIKIRRSLPGATVSVSEHFGMSASGRKDTYYTLHVIAEGRVTEVLVMQPDLAAAVNEVVRRVQAKLAA